MPEGDTLESPLVELVEGTGYRAVVLDRLVRQSCELVGAPAACLLVRRPDHHSEAIVAVAFGLDEDAVGRTVLDLDAQQSAVVDRGTDVPVPPEDGGRGRLEVRLASATALELRLLERQAKLIGAALDHARVPPGLTASILDETAELARELDESGGYGLPKEVELELVRAVAEELRLPAADIVEVELATLLYPLGELARSERGAASLRRAPRAGSDRFAEAAADTLAAVPGLEPTATILRHQDEHVDGGGAPAGLAGERIPVASRIVAACRALSGLLFPSRGRPSLSLEDALARIRTEAGGRFDPAVVAALERSLERVLAGPDQLDGR